MKNLYFLLLIFFGTESSLHSQVPKKIVVEHFTNTRCSICASQNPGFYANLANHPEILHVAIHPSSPYPACLLSQYNVVENDARTNYYGIYGSTPKLSINGVLVSSSADYSSASIFSPYVGLISPASIRIEEIKYDTDSIRSRISIKTVATHTLGNLKLFVALTEDTIFYASPNGETLHQDIFRKSLTGATGISFSLSGIVGDSVVYTKSSVSNTAWNFSRIHTIAILQDAITKSVVQSEYTFSKPSVASGLTSFEKITSSIRVFVSPNEQKVISISQQTGLNTMDFILYDLTGRVLLNKVLQLDSEKISVTDFSTGIYLFYVKSEGQVLKTGKLIIE